MDIPSGKLEGLWQKLSFEVNSESGIHALWIEAIGGKGDLFDIDWIRFDK